MCPQCGTRDAEWDPDLGGDPYAYTAVGHKCWGCEEIQREQKEIPDGAAGAGMKALLLPTSVLAAQEVEAALASGS
ncbi:hypothetical protein ACFRCX_30310 [Streptomyces sp. NPDC056652]|uniref:hypothetical protein n=1 Tax=Streptomyces sp. NPDC056652 TaxID=3345893 RepID=UPI0036C398F0